MGLKSKKAGIEHIDTNIIVRLATQDDEKMVKKAEKLLSKKDKTYVFEDAAIEAILNAADGTPRIINKLCNASLLIGHSSNLNIINTDTVMQAINDCFKR